MTFITRYEACVWMDEKLRNHEALNALISEKYRLRLPSEAEWEYAACYSEVYLYPWSESRPHRTTCEY